MNSRMFSGIIMFLFIAVILIPGVAFSQARIGLSLGAAIPTGDLGDVSGTGFSIGADYFTHAFDNIPRLVLGGRFAFNQFNDKSYDRIAQDVSSSATSVEIVPSLRYFITEEDKRVSYFAQFGPGLYLTMFDFNNFPDDENETEIDFGVSFGGGVTYKLVDTITVMAMPLFHLTDNRFISLNVGFIFGRRPAGM